MRLFLITLLFALPAFLLAQAKLEQLAHLPFPDETLAGCWHYANQAGKEYALVGTSKGLSIVDVSNPKKPFLRYQIPMPNSNWREIKTWKDFAYVVTEAPNSGLYIIDLRQLPDTVLYKTWHGDGAYAGQVVTNHTLTIDDGYLYLFGGHFVAQGVVICDLSDPWNPTITGQYNANYIHDGYVRNDTLWGAEMYAGQFSVIDVKDKTNPKLLAVQPTPGAFNHNTWLSDDGQTLYTTDEVLNAPLTAFDIRDLRNVKLLDVYYPSLDPSREVHNVRSIDNYLINPSYGGQLSLVDARFPDNLIELAIVKLGSSMVWDANPYLPSGTIIATAKNEGLFLYKPVYQRGAYLHGIVTDASTGQPLFDATVTIIETGAADMSEYDGVFKTGSAKSGRYTVEVEKYGFELQTLHNIALTNGQITALNIAMQPVGTLAAQPKPQSSNIKAIPNPAKNNMQLDLAQTAPGKSRGLQQSRSSRPVRKDITVNTEQLEINDLGHLPNALHYLQVAGRTEQLAMPILKN
jgi:choice-of-anchor B domain-containing protein